MLVQWDGTQPTTPSFEQRPPVWLMLKALLNNARSAIIRNVLRRRPPPPELDEDGYPVDWRIDPFLDPYFQSFLVKSADHWPIFSKWCEVKSLKALPASEETVLMFLLDPPVEGEELYKAWWAIFFRHEAYYWMEDVDPCYLLRRKGVDVEQDGTVVVPEEARQAFGL